MSAPKIRFIVETLSDHPRPYTGGPRHLATVTSTITGRSLRYLSKGPRNAATLVRRATNTWDCLHCTEQDATGRQFNWATNGVIVYDHQVEEAHILALEVQP